MKGLIKAPIIVDTLSEVDEQAYVTLYTLALTADMLQAIQDGKIVVGQVNDNEYGIVVVKA